MENNDTFRSVEEIPVVEGNDIIVLGGGIAGISAAVAAARRGQRVLLVEKLCNAGGLATGGFISYYLPICDGLGTLVCRGLAEELLTLASGRSIDEIKSQTGPAGPASVDRNRIESFFYPGYFQAVLDEYLEKNGVEILYDAAVENPVMDESRCSGVIINRREGRALFTARVFIDATGDALIMHRAGADTRDGENMLSGWYYSAAPGGIYSLEQAGADAHEAFREIKENSGSEGGPLSYRGITSSEITKYVKDVKKRILEEERSSSDRNEKTVAVLPSVPQLRCHRRIAGIDEVSDGDMNRYCETSVGCAGDWREPGIVYEVPFGSLISDKIDNIITAGRTVSASGDAYEVLRCIPQCAVTGEAAGTAAALYCSEKTGRLIDLDIRKLQTGLEKAGAVLHYSNP